MEELEIRGKNQGHPDNRIINIDENTQKSLGNQERLAVAQYLLKGYRLKLVLKTCKK